MPSFIISFTCSPKFGLFRLWRVSVLIGDLPFGAETFTLQSYLLTARRLLLFCVVTFFSKYFLIIFVFSSSVVFTYEAPLSLSVFGSFCSTMTGNTLCMILFLLNLLSLVSWHSIWSDLENAPCLLEEPVGSAVAGGWCGSACACLLSLVYLRLLQFAFPVNCLWLFFQLV